MKRLLILKTQALLSNPFVDRFIEGGPFFMSIILLCLILIFYFIAKGFLSKDNVEKTKKNIALIADVSLLGLVIGFFSSIIGLITAFDSLEAINGMANSGVFAAGLKVSFLSTVFGTLVFIIGRIGILILRL
ncbi:MotA/TolQ/ExbB proton channel family protein [Flavobacteriaceae sp. LMIT009]